LATGQGSSLQQVHGAEQYRITDELASYTSPQRATIDGRAWCLCGLAVARGIRASLGKSGFSLPLAGSSVGKRQCQYASCRRQSECFFRRPIKSKHAAVGATRRLRRLCGAMISARRDKAMRTHWNTPIHVEGYLYGSSGATRKTRSCVAIGGTRAVMWSEPASFPNDLPCFTSMALRLSRRVRHAATDQGRSAEVPRCVACGASRRRRGDPCWSTVLGGTLSGAAASSMFAETSGWCVSNSSGRGRQGSLG